MTAFQRLLPRRAWLSALAATTALALLGPGAALAQSASKKELVIGGTAGSNIDQLKAGIVPLLEKKGYQGALDANFFQHRVYLRKFAADQKLDLVELVQGPIAPLGVYSTRRKTLAEAREGDRVTLPNDPSNLARALVLLEQNHLVKLKAGIDPLRASEKDLEANPLKLKLIPLEAAQLPRSLGDAEFAIINGNFAISSGLKLTEAVALEKTPDHYLNVVAVKRADQDTPWARDIAEAYRSKEFKAVVDSRFAGYAKPAFLQ